MTDSILDSTKKALNLEADYTEFDPEIIMFINAVFSTLNQLGIGPDEGFAIESNAELWSTFLGNDLRLNNVKNYMYLRVRLSFDPPTTAYHMSAMKEQIEELEVRISIYRESTEWTRPTPVPFSPDEEYIFDGGSA